MDELTDEDYKMAETIRWGIETALGVNIYGYVEQRDMERISEAIAKDMRIELEGRQVDPSNPSQEEVMTALVSVLKDRLGVIE